MWGQQPIVIFYMNDSDPHCILQGRIPPQDAQGGFDVGDEEVVQLLVSPA